MAVPYEKATSGAAAREEITRLLRRLGCERIGFMDDFGDSSVLLAFEHRGMPMQLKAVAKGWAAMFLKENPWTSRHKRTLKDYESAALQQGRIAVNSILRDWVKGQVTAIECGILSFEEVFLPQMLLPDGKRLIEKIIETKLLPAPSNEREG